MSLFWKLITVRNDRTKTKADQFRALIENLESNDLRVMLQHYSKSAEFAGVIMEILANR
jgi:hypothetical protein